MKKSKEKMQSLSEGHRQKECPDKIKNLRSS